MHPTDILRGRLLRKLSSRHCVFFLRYSSYLPAKRADDTRDHPIVCSVMLTLLPARRFARPIVCFSKHLIALSTDRPDVYPLLVLSSGCPIICSETTQIEETRVATAHNIPSFEDLRLTGQTIFVNNTDDRANKVLLLSLSHFYILPLVLPPSLLPFLLPSSMLSSLYPVIPLSTLWIIPASSHFSSPPPLPFWFHL